MKTGKLTEVEKLAIDNMVEKGFDLDKIKTTLDRSLSSKVVEKYIGSQTTPQKQVSYDHRAVIKKMDESGIRGEDALNLIKRALKNFEGKDSIETGALYNEAVKLIGPRELMIRESQNGVSKGVTIMTGEAAKIGDRGDRESRGISEQKKQPSRSTRGSLFHPKTGESC